MNKYLINYQLKDALPGFGKAFATALCCIAFTQSTIAQEQKPANQLKPYLQAPIKFEAPGKKPLAPGELAALNVARIEKDAADILRQKNCASENKPKSAVPENSERNQSNAPKSNCTDAGFVDRAFGAYQRGYYLSAFKLALPRAESGDPAAQTLIAELFDKGLGVALDRKKAANWYRFAANGGNREAQFAHANILAKGKTVPFDKEGAQKFMKKAADAGHNKAQFNYAQMIINNKPGYSGYVEAKPYYEKAAKGGLSDAQYVLARMHATGKGFSHTDLVRARKWMTLAAIGGFDTAQLELAIWMAIGKGGAKDQVAALSWFKLAANQGNVIAQNRLARMYAYGLGTKRNIINASAWHILARRAGKSDREMDQLFRELSTKEQKRAIKIANTWRSR